MRILSSLPRYKRAVSPLIATILLIAFAVALGSVIMNWGLSTLTAQGSEACKDVEITLQKEGDSDFCYGGAASSGYVTFTLLNSGDADISGIILLLTGEKKSEYITLDDISIPIGSTFKKNNQALYHFNDVGAIQNVQIIPKLKVDSKTEICTKSAAEPKSIAKC